MIRVQKGKSKTSLIVGFDTARERVMLEALFHNTYKIQDLVNNNLANVFHQTEKRFTHEEIKQAVDAFYIALVTNRD